MYQHEEGHHPHPDEPEEMARHDEGHHHHTEEPVEPADSGPNKFVVGLLAIGFVIVVLIALVIWQP